MLNLVFLFDTFKLFKTYDLNFSFAGTSQRFNVTFQMLLFVIKTLQLEFWELVTRNLLQFFVR